MFSRILIANRGEIAIRIARACRQLHIQPVAVYSEADAHALHVRTIGEAVAIGPASASESYLRIDRIIEAALHSGCQAVHPGYGFLSENADFAEAVIAAGLTFIGPSPAAIRAMGIKTAALDRMRSAGVPTVPGNQPGEPLIDAAARIGYPVLIKAAAGGGGKGMRIVLSPADLTDAIDSAQREARHAFGDDRIFIEKYLESARHIEFQIVADQHDHTVHLFERECSIQRRHQKIVEETPSPLLDDALRTQMGAAAVAAARAVNYVNAGTVEFIVDSDRHFYFLEMNTRLQVEHPITEWVTGLDLVALQIRIAAGEALPFDQADLVQRGHAIECRIYAEDPAADFMPSIGTLTRLIEPTGPGVRIDGGVATGASISIYYDPLIAKLSVYGADREAAIARMDQALNEYQIEGVRTNLAFLRDVIDHPVFRAGQATTRFIEDHLSHWTPPTSRESDTLPEAKAMPSIPDTVSQSPWARADGFRLGGGVRESFAAVANAPLKADSQSMRTAADRSLTAVMPGQVTGVLVSVGDSVTHGQTLITLEAMKMELRVTAPRDGQIARVHCTQGKIVARGDILIELVPPSE